MIIDYKALSKEALTGVIEDFVSREGTDYGQTEWQLSHKVDHVHAQLKNGVAVIVYDAESDSCSIQPATSIDPSIL